MKKLLSGSWVGASAHARPSVLVLFAIACASIGPVYGQSSAAFVKVDTVTEGSWKELYGQDGYTLAGDVSSLPAYVQLSLAGNNTYTWNPSTSDPRALLKGNSATDRIAATWYGSAYTIDLNLTDGQVHPVAIYLLDWDLGNRSETLTVQDAGTKAALDSRTINGFANGQYVVWNLSGHVQIQVTVNSGPNAVISGIFFKSLPTVPPPSVAITAPAQNQIVSGPVTLSASASSGAAIASVQFQVDSVNLGTPITTPPYTATWNSLAAQNGAHSLTAIAVDSFGQSTTSAAVSVTVSNAVTSAVVVFQKLDTVLQGSWKNTYGKDGYIIEADSSFPPAYATVNVTGASVYTWFPSTTDPRALLKSGSLTDRIASTWYSFSGFSIDVNLADAETHQVALYCLDWDTTSRSESVTIVDANTQNVLDTRTVSSFSNGVYLIWNVSGHVTIQLNRLTGPNAVLSGIFFSTPPSGPPPVVALTAPTSGQILTGSATVSASASSTIGIASVQFQLDDSNLGAAVTASPYTIAWNTVQAANGSHSLKAIATDLVGQQTTSAAVPVTVSNVLPPLPAVSITAPTANQTVALTVNITATASSTVGIASVQFKLDGSPLGSPVTTTPYSLSWNTVTTAANGPHSLTAVATDTLGQQNTSAAVAVTVTNVAAPGPTATFHGLDTTTRGNWKNVYGQDGYLIEGDSNALPAYAAVTVSGANAYTWASSTTDPRALIKGASTTDRIASTWYLDTSYTIDVNVTDGQTHQIALYCLDWDSTVRSQRFTILDASNQNVLDTETISSYSNGVYAVWNISGHITIQVTRLAGANAVVSGLFFGSPVASVAITAPAKNQTVSATVTVSAAASAPSGIASVQFQLDGINLGAPVTVSPYSILWDTTTATNTTHSLTALATNNLSQQVTSLPVTVTVNNLSPPPTVSITAPAQNQTLSGPVSVSATASSSTGIAGVQFQLDSVNLGSAVTTPPYSITWNTLSASNASHVLTAIATDVQNQQTTSAPVTVTVNNLGTAVQDTTVADFSAGTGTNTYISQMADGEVIQAPAAGSEFSGSFLPAGWTVSFYNPAGFATVANGVLTVEATKVIIPLTKTSGSMDFVATYTHDPDQHIGFAVDLMSAPWALFSTGSLSELIARTDPGTQINTVVAGTFTGAPHHYRIDWGPTGFVYWIDGQQVASHAASITTAMQPQFANQFTTSHQLNIDWVHVSPYASSATFTSRVLDAGSTVMWSNLVWTADTPTGTSVAMSVRTGNTPTPDGTWTGFTSIANGGPVSTTARYVQYQAILATTDPSQTAVLRDVTISYSTDITAVQATSITTSSATISWTTATASDSQVDYGTSAAYGNTTPLAAALVTSHSVSLSNLAVNTPYHYRVKSRDASNVLTVSGDFTFTTLAVPDAIPPTVSLTAPTANQTVSGPVTVSATANDNVGVVSVQFYLDSGKLGTAILTPPYMITWDSTLVANGAHTLSAVALDAAGNPGNAPDVSVTVSNTAQLKLIDTTATDFGAGTGVNTYISSTSNGEVIQAPAAGSEFAAFPSGWFVSPFGTGGSATTSSGALTVDGALTGTSALYTPSRSVEFVATFSTDILQHIGFGVDFQSAPWAIFSTYGGGGLYARTNNGDQSLVTLIPGSYLGTSHKFRIDWTPSGFAYWVDGVQVASHAAPISANMRLLISDEIVGAGQFVVAWMRLTPYATPATFTSRVLDAGSAANWGTMSWTAQLPAGTSIAMKYRTGDTATPDLSWTAFASVASSGSAISGVSRYIQYQAVLSSTDPGQTASLNDVTVAYSH